MISKGEGRILEILQKNRIYFQKEKTFNDLKHGLFRYDFYIPDYNGRQVAIEYNGEQHYQFIAKYFSNRRDWQRAQERDRRKISYCLANEINLYCIPYWELSKLNNLDDIINEKYRARDRWKNDNDWQKYREGL